MASASSPPRGSDALTEAHPDQRDAPGLEPDLAGAPIGPRQGWRDLAVVAAIVALSALTTAAPVPFRVPIGLVAILYVPGYLLSCVALPSRLDLDGIGRTGMALGLSPALVAIVALLMDRLGFGLKSELIPTAMGLLNGVLLVVAVLRRIGVRRRPEPVAPAPPSERFAGRAARFTQALVVANVLAAALAYGLATSRPAAAGPTEFYVLGAENRLAGYPREVPAGTPLILNLGVRQEEGRAASYRVVVRQDEKELTSVGPVRLNGGQRWESPISVPTGAGGRDQEFAVHLLRDGADQPFRTLRLWVDVVTPTPEGGP